MLGNMTDEELDELTDAVPVEEEAPGKKTKKVYLKQYLVSGSADIYDGKIPRTGAFILATCAKTAREEFERKFPGMQVLNCSQTAETEITKEEAEGRDFWAEKSNWTMEVKPPESNPRVEAYFALKARAEKVQAARKKAGIAKWGEETDEQRRIFDDELERLGEPRAFS